MNTPTHAIVHNQNGSYSVALMTGLNGTEINDTWGEFTTYVEACESAQGDAQERSDKPAVFGENIRESDLIKTVTTQDLIDEAKKATGIHCDGLRQFSGNVNGIECEIITRGHPGTWGAANKGIDDSRPDTTRIQFWNGSVRISRAAAEKILAAS